MKKLYSVADPLIQRLPGRDVEEKRALFNAIVIVLVVAFYLSPLPVMIANTRTAWGVVLAILLLLVAPIILGMYLLDVIAEYGERWRAVRKQMKQEKSAKNT